MAFPVGARCGSLVLGAVASLALGLAVAPAVAQSAKPSFVGAGAFNVCTDATFPPMEYFVKSGDAEPAGFDIDLAKALAKRWSVAAKFFVMDFSGLLPSLEAKRCDAVISGILLNEERLKTFDGAAYLSTYGILIGKKGTPAVAKAEELAGKTIAVQTGTSYIDIVKKMNDDLVKASLKPMEVQQYPKASDVVQQVLVGRAFAGTTQDTELAFREAEDPGKFALVYTIPGARQFGIFTRKNEADTAAVKTAVRDLAADGTLPAIATRWKLSAEQIAKQ